MELAPLNIYEYEFDASVCYNAIDLDRLLEASLIPLTKQQQSYLENLITNDVEILSSIINLNYCQQLLEMNSSIFSLQLRALLRTTKSQQNQRLSYSFYEAILQSPSATSLQLMDVVNKVLSTIRNDYAEEISSFFNRYIVKCKSEYHQSSSNVTEKNRKCRLICLLLLALYKNNPSLVLAVRYSVMDLITENFKLKEAVELYGIFTTNTAIGVDSFPVSEHQPSP